MSYFINPVEEAKCVFLTHEGQMSLSETTTVQQEIAGMLTARRWNRVMVDVTAMESVPKAAEVFALGESLPRTLPRSARVALVVRPDQAKHARLLEQVARRRGAFLTFFVDAGKAEVWLRATPSFMGSQLFSTSSAPRHSGTAANTM